MRLLIGSVFIVVPGLATAHGPGVQTGKNSDRKIEVQEVNRKKTKKRHLYLTV